MSKKFKLITVRIGSKIRCVYINDFRIVGNKPWISENQISEDFTFNLTDLQHAFPELEIKLRQNDKTC